MYDMFDEGEQIEDKIYLDSPLNYTGSKFRLLQTLEENYPKDVTVMYDLFCGGGSVFANAPFQRIIANDIIVPLIQFYNLIRSSPWTLLESFIKESYIRPEDKDGYLLLRERFNQSGNPVDFFILCCSCQNNMMRFNKQFKFNQTWGNRHYSDVTKHKLKKYHKKIFENAGISFINKNFYDVEIEDGAFVYMDPPYLITSAGYNTYWSKDHEAKLYDLIDSLDARGIKFMMSNVAKHKGKTNPHMDQIEKYNIKELKFDYDKVSRAGDSDSVEILVKNY